jgi:hypothetical protein
MTVRLENTCFEPALAYLISAVKRTLFKVLALLVIPKVLTYASGLAL